MTRRLLLLALATLALTDVGCATCRKIFGLDRRCDAPPPPAYYSQQPVMTAPPVQYAPQAPCNK